MRTGIHFANEEYHQSLNSEIVLGLKHVGWTARKGGYRIHVVALGLRSDQRLYSLGMYVVMYACYMIGGRGHLQSAFFAKHGAKSFRDDLVLRKRKRKSRNFSWTEDQFCFNCCRLTIAMSLSIKTAVTLQDVERGTLSRTLCISCDAPQLAVCFFLSRGFPRATRSGCRLLPKVIGWRPGASQKENMHASMQRCVISPMEGRHQKSIDIL